LNRRYADVPYPNADDKALSMAADGTEPAGIGRLAESIVEGADCGQTMHGVRLCADVLYFDVRWTQLSPNGRQRRARRGKDHVICPFIIIIDRCLDCFRASALAQDVRTQARHSPVVDPTRGNVTLTFSGGCTVGITPAELKDINLALLYRVQGRYADAEPLYKRALAIGEKALGPDHPAVAIRLNNLALLYRVQGRYADAEPLYKRALAIDEKALGPDHPAVAIRLNNLAGLYRAQGHYADAEPLFKRALAIDEKALGPDHPNTKTIRDNLRSVQNILSSSK
jgi:tetratricopeptide (TPR) repeat protein